MDFILASAVPVKAAINDKSYTFPILTRRDILDIIATIRQRERDELQNVLSHPDIKQEEKLTAITMFQKQPHSLSDLYLYCTSIEGALDVIGRSLGKCVPKISPAEIDRLPFWQGVDVLALYLCGFKINESNESEDKEQEKI